MDIKTNIQVLIMSEEELLFLKRYEKITYIADTMELYKKAGIGIGKVGFGEKPAIITIDQQYAFTSPESALGTKGANEETRKTIVTGVEMFNKTLDEGQAGDNIGVLLRGVEKKDLERGQVVAAPGSITPHTKFESEVYVLTKEEGGRHTPFFANYKPQFYFRTTDVTGEISLPEGTEMVMPGDNVHITGELITPVAMSKDLRFAIREGGKTVGAGRVTDILE